MTRVLVTFAGGSYGLGITRALRSANEAKRRGYYIIAADADIYSLQRAEADEKHLLPVASDPGYIDALKVLVSKTGADVLWTGHDAETQKLAHALDEFSDVDTFLPSAEDIDLCNDKWASYRAFKKAGIRTPETRWLDSPEDLEAAFGAGYSDGVWVRAISGAGGRGGAGFKLPEKDKAKAWIDLHDGWGNFTASKWIVGNGVRSLETVWYEGELIVAQRKMPIAQGFAKLTRSGVTGVPGIARWGGPPEMDEVGQAAVRAVSAKPHGNYGIDTISDRDGNLYVTEINIGRYFNDGLIHWPDEKFNGGDLNVQLALGNGPPFDPPLWHPRPEGNVVIFGLPKMPIEVSEAELDRYR